MSFGLARFVVSSRAAAVGFAAEEGLDAALEVVLGVVLGAWLHQHNLQAAVFLRSQLSEHPVF